MFHLTLRSICNLLVGDCNIPYMSSRSISLTVLFGSTISLLIFSLFDLIITEKGVLKSLTMRVELFISLSSSISLWLKLFDSLLLGAYTFRRIFFWELMYLSSIISLSLIIIPDNFPCSEFGFVWSNITTLAFFWLMWEWYIFLYSFTFNFPFSVYLMFISCRKYSWICFILFDKLFFSWFIYSILI